MINLRKINPLLRSIGVIGAVAGMVTAVTFAQLTTNTVTLASNELDATSDVLRISNGGAFSTSVAGFANSNLIVGNEGPKNAFYFQNLANVALSISVHIPGSPASSGLDLTKVHIKFYDRDNATLLADKTVADLESGSPSLADQLDANAQGNGGAPGTEGNYFYSVTVGPGAVTGSPAQVPSFNLDFTGTEI